MSDDPAFIAVGNHVSAKFKGAFCEAVVTSITKEVKCKIHAISDPSSNITVEVDQLEALDDAPVHVGSVVRHQGSDHTVLSVRDHSLYRVAFNDGDERSLRRNNVHLKGAKHFADSDNLDTLPLDNPEASPIIASIREAHKRTRPLSACSHASSTETKDDISNLGCELGSVVRVFEDPVQSVMSISNLPRTRRWYPALIVTRSAISKQQRSGVEKTKGNVFVRSFRDGRFASVNPSRLEAIDLLTLRGLDVPPSLKNACEKSLAYLENKVLPPHWDHDHLLGVRQGNGKGSLAASSASVSSDAEENSDGEGNSSDDAELSEERDLFVAYLFKFMDERGTPINGTPTVAGSQELNLHKLYKLVHDLGGFNKVTSRNQWRNVQKRMGLGGTLATPLAVKNAYTKYLHQFAEFYRKLGTSWDEFLRINRPSSSHHRNVLPASERERVQKEAAALKASVPSTSADADLPSTSKRKIVPVARPSTVLHRSARQKLPGREKTKRRGAFSWVSKACKVLIGKTGRSSPGSVKLNPVVPPGPGRRFQRSVSVLPDGGGSSQWKEIDSDGNIKSGDMVRVKYGHGSQLRLYKAKIQSLERNVSTQEVRFRMHYFGWNVRYDEWVPRSRLHFKPSQSSRGALNVIGSERKASEKQECPRGSGSADEAVLSMERGRRGCGALRRIDVRKRRPSVDTRSLTDSPSCKRTRSSARTPHVSLIETEKVPATEPRSTRSGSVTPTHQFRLRQRHPTDKTTSSDAGNESATATIGKEDILDGDVPQEEETKPDTDVAAAPETAPLDDYAAEADTEDDGTSTASVSLSHDTAAVPPGGKFTKPSTVSRTKRRRRRNVYQNPVRKPTAASRQQKFNAEESDADSAGGEATTSHASSSNSALRAKIMLELSEQEGPKDVYYSFNQIDLNLQGEEKIAVLLQRMDAIRETYQKLRVELTDVDRRRKKALEEQKTAQKKN